MSPSTRLMILAAGLLVSCGGSSKDAKLKEQEVDALFIAPLVPTQTAITAMFLLPFVGSFGVECPAVTELESGGFKVEGDCTTEGGDTWSGSMLWEGADITWDAFEMPGMSIDGSQSIFGNGLTSNLSVTMSDGDVSHAMTYTDYKVPNFMEFYTASLTEAPYSLDFSGKISVDDLGEFDTTGSVQDDLTCESEPTSGGFTMVGEFTFEVTFDGGTDCDGCIGWTTDDHSGSKCYEEGDTGGGDDTGG
jgi:hypothetical protein